MPNLIAEITARRARRALAETPIAPEIVDRLARAASLAPSCSNNQPWRLLFLTEPAARERAHGALTPGNYWAKRAPLLVIVFTRLSDACRREDGREYAFFDCGLAAENLMLQATAEGLVAHAMAGYDGPTLKRAFGLPEDAIPIVLIAAGYPGDESGLAEKHRLDERSPQNRKPLEEILFYNSL